MSSTFFNFVEFKVAPACADRSSSTIMIKACLRRSSSTIMISSEAQRRKKSQNGKKMSAAPILPQIGQKVKNFLRICPNNAKFAVFYAFWDKFDQI